MRKGLGKKLDAETAKRIKKISEKHDLEAGLLESDRLAIERVATGIKGFDELVEGGIPKNFLVLVTGGPGTGKTTFGIEFLVQGALNGEKGAFISLDEDEAKLEKQLKQFGWPVEELEKKGLLFIFKPTLFDFTKLKETIQDNLMKSNVKRVVIDSISLLDLYFKDKFTVRRAIIDLETALREIDCTSLLVSETENPEIDLSPLGVEEFVSDGIVVFYLTKNKDTFKRGLAVRKMRLTDHSLKIHPLEIKKKIGISISPQKDLSA